jgi:hypothetical protein
MDEKAMGLKYAALSGKLDERALRLCAGADARMLGRGGIAWWREPRG